MGLFSRIGSKIAGGVSEAGRLGKKVLGGVSRIGHKISHQGSAVVSGIERVPIVGQALAPATGVARSALGMIENVASGADKGLSMINRAEGLVREGRDAVRTGDLQQAQQVLRRSGDLGRDVKDNLQKAKKNISSQLR
jgi:hypothetical protein